MVAQLADCNEKYLVQDNDVEEISILDILIIIAEYKKFIISVMLLFSLVGVIYAFFFSKQEYVSTLQVAPVMPSMSKTGEFNIYLSSGLIRGIMQSDAVLDYAIEKNDLLKDEDGAPRPKLRAREELAKQISFRTAQRNEPDSGIVTLNVKGKTPELAQSVASSIYDASLETLNSLGMLTSKGRDAYLADEIKSSVEKLKEYKKTGTTEAIKGDTELNELLKTLSIMSLYDEGSVYRNKIPMIVQLVSPASLPDDKEPQGRAKMILLSALLGLFVGLTLAFIRHFWNTSSSDPESAAKIARLKELMGIGIHAKEPQKEA